MPTESSRPSLPFEPRQNKKKIAKPPVNQVNNTPKINSAYDKQNASLSGIPEEVSNAMVKRMIYFSGIPTFLGISSFFLFYLVVRQEWFKVPTSAVVLVTMGLFGLGVLGLTYSILSTCWDADRKGSFWGWEEVKINFPRMTSAWSSARKESLDQTKVKD